MKSTLIFVAISGMIFLGFFPAVNAVDKQDSGAVGETHTPQPKPDKDTALGSTEVDEPNAAQARAETLKDFAGELKSIDYVGQKEIRQWARSATERSDELAEVVSEVIEAELNFIRRLALSEHAEKTTTAIDELLVRRHKRFSEIVSELEEQLRRIKQREQKKETPRTRSRTRDSRDRHSRSR